MFNVYKIKKRREDRCSSKWGHPIPWNVGSGKKERGGKENHSYS